MEIHRAVSGVGGVAHTSRLETLGFSGLDAREAVRAGVLMRIRRGWVNVPGAPEDVVRAVRVGGSLTSVSLLQSRGVWCVSDGLLHVRVGRHTSHLASPDDRGTALAEPLLSGVCLHRTRLGHVQTPLVAQDSVDEALMQMVRCQDRDHSVAAFDSSLRKRLTNRYRLTAQAARLTQKHRDIVALADARSHSGLETKARLRLRALGIPYRTQVPVSGVGAVDLVVGDRLVIELDGREWHSSEEAFAEDRRRDFILHERGGTVLRFTYAHVIFEWERIEALVRGLVSRGDHRWSNRQLRAGLGPTLG